MILHYAHLCAAAGGIDAFLVGSEMFELTTIRSGASTYPAVTALKALAADVRAILRAGTKIGYAADWSEYFGYHPGEVRTATFEQFNLDLAIWTKQAAYTKQRRVHRVPISHEAVALILTFPPEVPSV